jgi:hypothetical protein
MTTQWHPNRPPRIGNEEALALGKKWQAISTSNPYSHRLTLLYFDENAAIYQHGSNAWQCLWVIDNGIFPVWGTVHGLGIGDMLSQARIPMFAVHLETHSPSYCEGLRLVLSKNKAALSVIAGHNELTTPEKRLL